MTIQEKITDILDRLSKAPLPVIDLSLTRITQFLNMLDNPEKRLPPVIHVAGTNGKGSLVAYLQAIFTEAGFLVHSYISPHLVSFSERIIINGKQITDEKLLDVLQRVEQKSKNFPLTFYEATTAAAFLAFSENNADILLLETGLGGRLDATNIVEKPLLTAITPIGMDHMNFLGNNLLEIAQEKAGIIKNSVPCVVGNQAIEVNELLKIIAQQKNAPLFIQGRDYKITAYKQAFDYIEDNEQLDNLVPSLAGKHQYENAATAIACIKRLPQFQISEKNIRSGIQKAVWNARLQLLKSGNLVEILPKDWNLWLDGGHNPAAGAILANWCEHNNKKPYLIVGMVQGKDAQGFLSPLKEYAQSTYLVPIIGEETSMQPKDLAAAIANLSLDINIETSVKAALERIVSEVDAKTVDILICGSLYLAGKVLAQNDLNKRG